MHQRHAWIMLFGGTGPGPALVVLCSQYPRAHSTPIPQLVLTRRIIQAAPDEKGSRVARFPWAGPPDKSSHTSKRCASKKVCTVSRLGRTNRVHLRVRS
jgi:hypothetical protein